MLQKDAIKKQCNNAFELDMNNSPRQPEEHNQKDFDRSGFFEV